MEMAKRSPTPNLDSSDDEDVGNEEAKRVRTSKGWANCHFVASRPEHFISTTRSESDRLMMIDVRGE